MTTNTIVLGLTAETSIHAGASGANNVIDLPIMREHNTGYPVIYGSAVKGALRAKAELGEMPKSGVFALFGPDTDNASDHAGSLMVGDARLLALPVRSLTSQFRYVTSPNLLQRWQRDLIRAGQEVSFTIPKPNKDEAIVTQSETVKNLFLEDFVYQTSQTDLTDLINVLAKYTSRETIEFEEKLTILHDDQLTLLCRSAIPVNAHIALDSATKTVKSGALWYQETLPAETLLYSLVGAHQSRSKDFAKSANELLDYFVEELFAKAPYLQLGGNETTGMGWCNVKVTKGAN